MKPNLFSLFVDLNRYVRTLSRKRYFAMKTIKQKGIIGTPIILDQEDNIAIEALELLQQEGGSNNEDTIKIYDIKNSFSQRKKSEFYPLQYRGPFIESFYNSTLEHFKNMCELSEKKKFKDNLNKDISLYVTEGKLITQTYIKPVDQNRYLNFSSSHKNSWKINIPKGQFIRLKRNCGVDSNFKVQAAKLYQSFREQGYPDNILQKALTEVNEIDRANLLKTSKKSKSKSNTDRTALFTTQYNNCAFKIRSIIKKNSALLKLDNILRENVDLEDFYRVTCDIKRKMGKKKRTFSQLEVALIVIIVLLIGVLAGFITVIFVLGNRQCNPSAATTSSPQQTLSAATDPYTNAYLLGAGRADCTGYLSDVPLMGYASSDQKAGGLHTRQYSRAFIVAEPDNSKRVVFVSADIGMVSQRVRLEVMEKLKAKYGDLYRQDNVVLSGTHTHSGPSGYFQYTIFMLTSMGFHREATDAIVNGIVKSIDIAHASLKRGRIFVNKGSVDNSHINRSPSSYNRNPQSERDRYPANTDKDMVILKMVDMNGQDVGLISWFAVHAVSMPNTNHLISSDNMGYASYLFEQDMNKGSLPGEGSFVAAFASSNLGDVTPNTRGPHCINTGLSCENPTSTCPEGGVTACVATGPGADIFESTHIIGEQIFKKAKDFYNAASRKLLATVNSAHQWVDMSNVTVKLNDTHNATTCKPALGYSFAAGTIDGPGLINFTHGMTEGDPYWDSIRDELLGVPSNETKKCHQPKPILLNTGEMTRLLPWHPTIIDIQMITIGSLAIVAVPGEFTTMSGRRLREAVRKELDPSDTHNIDVVISGLSNVYTHYITTFEEYQAQRYEAASTIYGPHTLSAYLQLYRGLAKAITEATVDKLPRGPQPPFFNQSQLFTFLGPVLADKAPDTKTFGDVLVQVMPQYRPGDVASVTFVAGNPRSSVTYMTNDTYIKVEKYDNVKGTWHTVHNDASWETRYYWHKGTGSQSNATIEWHIPASADSGTYRIRHFGHYKQSFIPAIIRSYNGTSDQFQITN
ncbi:putative neutral ceramidase C [Pseudophryne corroboree]|uniref:putative neutral ceramidase C n=1 Tax=Pseudophryne corroboree TaxID=495146 RepID=UPI003081AEEC